MMLLRYALFAVWFVVAGIGALYVAALVLVVIGVIGQAACEATVDFYRWVRNPQRHWF